MNLLYALAASLCATLALELIFARLYGVRGRELLLVLLVNCLTNPPAVLLNALLRDSFPAHRLLIQLPIEALVVLTEGALYRQKSNLPHPWRFSLAANAVSYLTGILLSAVRIIRR